jgi:exopolysaccharide production protein ExoQ
MAQIILWVTIFFAIWAIRRDIARRCSSTALWIPTLWVGILASRPVSAWLHGGFQNNTATSSLEGSPIDMLFYLVIIVAASIVVVNRNPDWSSFVSRNWPVILFYFYLLVSVLWAESSLVSFKRWFKEAGNIMIVMVILTEKNPQQAFKAVFVRCAYLLIPLSIVFERYFPHLGRSYPHHSGNMQIIGVADQKNSLGEMILALCLVIIWDLLEYKRPAETKRDRINLLLEIGMVIMGLYLLHLCDSKTAFVSLMLGGSILATNRIPVLGKTVRRFGLWILGLILLFNLTDAFLEIKEALVEDLGRDMTLTTRTDIWHAIMQMHTDPLLGVGFNSFWSDEQYLSKLPEWVPHSAHNGYLEIYIDGGYAGLSLLLILLVVTAFRIHKDMVLGGAYSVVRYAVLVVAVVINFSESNFARMTPVGFLFILTAIEGLRRQGAHLTGRNRSFESVLSNRTRGSLAAASRK